MRLIQMLALFLSVASTHALAGATAPGLVAQWDLDEGQGDIVRDSSGNENHGKVHGANWVKLEKGFALAFDGVDDYVNCGRAKSLDVTGPVTLEVWVNPASTPSRETGIAGKSFGGFLLTYYTDANCWWYIASGTNNRKAHLENNAWQHVVGVFDGKTMTLYINGRVADSGPSLFPGPGQGGDFMIGCAGGEEPTGDAAFFKGMIGSVRVYGRALSSQEVQAHFKSEAGDYGFDTRWFTRLRMTPFYYFDRNQVVVEVDYAGLLPLPDGARILVQIRSPQSTAVRKKEFVVDPASTSVEARFDISDLDPGTYEITAGFATEGICPMEKAEFTYPPAAAQVPSVEEETVGPLPRPPSPPDFRVEVAGGGFVIRMGRSTLPVETWVSYPNGEFNWLAASRQPTHKQEGTWRVQANRVSDNEHRVTARGSFYSIERRILVRPDHVRIEDTYSNSTDNDLGLLIYNHLDASNLDIRKSYLCGYEGMGRKEEEASPSVFISTNGSGVGLVPLDDVSIVQSVCYAEADRAGVGTEKFAMGPKKSYTVVWAVYPNVTGDYYDFVNAVRRNEDRIGTIDGGMAFISKGPFQRRNIPSEEYLRLTNIKYGAIHCLSGAADDPQVSIEGIEFMDFPREMALLKEQMSKIHRQFPHLRVVVHVAHSLYCTNRPDRFADSKVINADGSQAVWGDPAHHYISEQREKEGWRWYIYYPTPGNSFHDALMKSVDVLMDEIGADGFFMDGFMWGYMGRWTYDRWDDHSAEIDKSTKTIRRKMGSVLLLSQPSLIQFARKVHNKGGVIVANNSVLTASICAEKYIIHDKEVSSGPFLHLAPNCAALTNPSAIKREKDVYLDALDKLKWGLLFFYYQEGDITYATLPSKCFPMTFEEIRSGMIRGPERIVTMLPGVYGWPGEPNLHLVHRYDARGGLTPYTTLSTVDADGVRSRLDLGTNESAVVEKLPIVLRTDGAPVNVIVRRYDRDAVVIALSGNAKATLEVRNGAFPVVAGSAYAVEGGNVARVTADATGALLVPLTLRGRSELTLRRAD